MNFAAIKPQLPDMAFGLFRQWVEKARERYPDLDFSIRDESLLVRDLKEAVGKSLVSLSARQKQTPATIAEHYRDIGFVQGFIESNLNQRWFHEYVVKRSEQYKRVVALSAVRRYLEAEETAALHIGQIYRDLWEEETNFVEGPLDASCDTTDTATSMTSGSGVTSKDLNTVSRRLEEVRYEMILSLMNQNTPLCVSGIQDQITPDQIERLIADNEPFLRDATTD